MRNLAIRAVVSFFSTVFLLPFHASDTTPPRAPEELKAERADAFDPGHSNEIQASRFHRLGVASGNVWEKRVRGLHGGQR